MSDAEGRQMWDLARELAATMGVEVRLDALEAGEEFQTRGGLCRLGGRLVAFVDRRADAMGRAAQLCRALEARGLDDVYVKPALRRFVESLRRSPTVEPEP